MPANWSDSVRVVHFALWFAGETATQKKTVFEKCPTTVQFGGYMTAEKEFMKGKQLRPMALNLASWNYLM